MQPTDLSAPLGNFASGRLGNSGHVPTFGGYATSGGLAPAGTRPAPRNGKGVGEGAESCDAWRHTDDLDSCIEGLPGHSDSMDRRVPGSVRGRAPPLTSVQARFVRAVETGVQIETGPMNAISDSDMTSAVMYRRANAATSPLSNVSIASDSSLPVRFSFFCLNSS